MATNKLTVTFEGPGVGAGVPLDDLRKTFERLQSAVRLMVNHLAGDDGPRRGRPSNDVRQASMLRLTGTSTGSLVAQIEWAPPSDSQLSQDDYGRLALEGILNSDQEGHDALPPSVDRELRSISWDLSPKVSSIRLGDPGDKRQVVIRRAERRQRTPSSSEIALLYGWLREVNWDKRTAQLHDSTGEFAALRFEPALYDDMLRFATRYVEVRGSGRFNREGSWTTVQVDEIKGTGSWSEPFDLEAFRSDPNPKTFDPDEIVAASEPFDVEEFIRVIHDARDLDRKEASDW